MNYVKYYHCPIGEEKCNGCAGEMDALRAIQAKLIQPRRKKANKLETAQAILEYIKRDSKEESNGN